MPWLLAYLTGFIVWLIICGVAIGEKPTVSRIVGAVIVALLWPIVTPIFVGAMIREYSK